MDGSLLRRCAPVAALLFVATTLDAADWNQWRGPSRTGLAPDSPPLLAALPDEGLPALWIAKEDLPRDGGWSCPVVAAGKVYLLTHVNHERKDVTLPPEKYPRLSDDERDRLPKPEREEYEKNRGDEQRERRKLTTRSEETIHCFDAISGKPLWANRHESRPTNFPQSNTPIVASGRLYVIGADRTVRCIDAGTGEKVWTTQLPVEVTEEQIASSPVVAGGVVVVMVDHLFGLDAKDGTIRWEGDANDTHGNDASPSLWKHAGKEYVVAHVDGRETIAVDPADCREIWRVKTDASRSSPVVVGDLLITEGSSRGKGLRCFKLSLEGAEPEWTFQGLQDPGSSPVVVGEHVYAQGERKVACVELATGKVAWQSELDLPQARYASVVAGGDTAFFLFERIVAFAARPEKFEVRWDGAIDDQGLLATLETHRRRLNLAEVEKKPDGAKRAEQMLKSKLSKLEPLECGSPALADGRLYVRLKHGLICYDLRAR